MLRKFATYCLLFFIPVIGIYCIAEYLTLNIPSSFTSNVAYMEAEEYTFENMVLGSSQMQQAVNPEWIQSSTLNMASGDQHHDTDFKLLKGMEDRLPHLKTIIFEVSYSHFEIAHNSKDFWKNNFYLKYYGINNFERGIYFKDKLAYLSNPPFFSKKIIEYYVDGEHKEVYNAQGFNTNSFHGQFQNLGHDEEKIAAMPRFKINTEPNLDIFEVNTRLYFEMLDYLQEKGYNVVICKVPMYKTYHDRKHPGILHRRDSILNESLERYANVTLFDLEQDTLNFEVHDFWNQSHLNPNGAEKYSRRLDSLLRTLK
ncbi:hypothetical protein POV27_10775 [Aureisphaera galaxeae]|uniref:hypothetical protein n=1 Tax=Aureisphaera galaxeae TaxID=1538023 RepID=UPI002350A68B|nr:hypothetical protein [Aureisphaera galaxeae]MDC8004532.1 hypothetical protein [Aureisphaera galaxeae]